MARPLRIESEGALDHVTSRGDRREPLFEDDGDAVISAAMQYPCLGPISKESRIRIAIAVLVPMR